MWGLARTTILVTLMVLFFAMPGVAVAAVQKSCVEDPRQPACNEACWLRADCLREQGSWEQTEAAAVACGPGEAGWGYCFVPVRNTEIVLPFLGAQDVSHTWRYARVIYLLVLSAGGLVGLLALLHAGFLWIIAHGHRPEVTRAKERMLHASLWLLILFGSYTILSMVNPVAMRLEEPRKVFLRSVR